MDTGAWRGPGCLDGPGSRVPLPFGVREVGPAGGEGVGLPLTAHHFNRYLLPIPSGVSP